MKEAICRYYRCLDYITNKEAMAGFSDSNTYVRYNWVDVCAWREGLQSIFIECETKFSMKRFKKKSERLHRMRESVTLALMVPESICRDHRWIWRLKGIYDQVMVYNEEKDRITKIHYLNQTSR